MAGKCRCAAACVQREYPKAVYVHCTSHTSNLCVVAACVFFSFPKRQLELEKQMEAMNIQIQIGKKKVSLCNTRWVSCLESLEVFCDFFLCLYLLLRRLVRVVLKGGIQNPPGRQKNF